MSANSDLTGRIADDAGPTSNIGHSMSDGGPPNLDAARSKEVVTLHNFVPGQLEVVGSVHSVVVRRS